MTIIYLLAGLVAGIAIGYLLRMGYAKVRVASAEEHAKKLIQEAEKEVEEKKKSGMQELRGKIEHERQELINENKQRKQELIAMERRLDQKEDTLGNRLSIVDKKEKVLADRERNIKIKEKNVDDEKLLVQKTREEQRQILEKVAGLTAEEAKKILFKNYEDEVKKEAALSARAIEQEAKENAEKNAKEILALAIQRVAADHTSDSTVATVPITNDELKGRVIGREGRNIRAFEQATGVDLIIDDTPEAITISSFDPIRREVARISMEKLIADGRIHPARIEEVVKKTQTEVEEICKEIGSKTALDLGVIGLHPEMLKLVGRLKFRTSYGQNQLQHTLEVAWISAAIAGEMSADIAFCKRAALLHDIGKAVDQNIEGTHHQISAELAKKYGESDKMINAILSHHEGIEPPKSVEAFIIAAGDAISAARPGARRESAEHYLKRLEKLEKIAMSFKGVSSAYAIQAGREIRVMVEPDAVDDRATYILGKELAKKIEQELEYPGQVKVVVIREVRAQEIAK